MYLDFKTNNPLSKSSTYLNFREILKSFADFKRRHKLEIHVIFIFFRLLDLEKEPDKGDKKK